MKRISSPMTVWNRRLSLVMPLAVLVTMGVAYSDPRASIDAWLPAMVALVAVFGIALPFYLMRDLADEVLKTKDGLRVRGRHGEQVRIAWADIEHISCTRWINPTRVTIALRRSTRLGRRIVFNPTWRLTNWAEHPIVAELRHHLSTFQSSHER